MVSCTTSAPLQNDVCGTNRMRLEMPVSHLFSIAAIISRASHKKSIFSAHSTCITVYFHKVSFPAGPSLSPLGWDNERLTKRIQKSTRICHVSRFSSGGCVNLGFLLLQIQFFSIKCSNFKNKKNTLAIICAK